MVTLSNQTNLNNSKSSRLKSEHVIPSHNISKPNITIPFLKSLIELYAKASIKSILYSVGVSLIGKSRLTEYSSWSSGIDITIPPEILSEKDLIGSIYQYIVPKNNRLEKGSFYTSQPMAESVVSEIDIKDGDTVFDPACGSGNLLFTSKITNPELITGIDFDECAVFCCKVNYYLKFGTDAPTPHIYCMDFCKFMERNSEKFDHVICNPPYGASINIPETVCSKDSLEYFIKNSSKLAKKSAIYILPESVINVKKYTSLREDILKDESLYSVTSYGSNFSGTMFSIISMVLNKTKPLSSFYFNNEVVLYDSIKKVPYFYFRPISGKNEEILQKVFKKKSQTLLGSEFGLGIVTGDNKNKIFNEQVPGSEPVITGKDVYKYNIITPKKYIIYDREKLQQVAPDSLYRSKEKVVYKTVSRNMQFAIDTTGTLTLNSANFFVPKNLSISTKCLVALLNSSLYDKVNKILYGENKISRKNLENLPLPDIDFDTQRIIEKYVDDEKFDKVDEIINELFEIN